MNLRANCRRAAAAGAAALAALALPGWALADAANPAADVSSSAGRSGRQVVDSVCIKCHGTGANGAPRIGDRANWSKRAEQGLTSLTQHALEGIRRMPAHGGNPGLNDLEIARAITYMVNRSGGHWVEPVSVGQQAAERTGEQVVGAQCVKCHGAGLTGAPRIGDRHAWLPRMKHGIDYLVRSAVHGHGGMPPRGGEADLTDGELRAAILYMFDPQYAAHAAQARKAATPAVSGPDANHALAGDLDVFLGIVSAQTLLAFPEGSAERAMHGGVPRGPDYYHVNVSLRNHADQAPVTDAQVAVQIEPAGAGGPQRAFQTLEPIPYEASYGNYLQLKRNTPYLITVQVRTPNAAQPLEAHFEQTLY